MDGMRAELDAATGATTEFHTELASLRHELVTRSSRLAGAEASAEAAAVEAAQARALAAAAEEATAQAREQASRRSSAEELREQLELALRRQAQRGTSAGGREPDASTCDSLGLGVAGSPLRPGSSSCWSSASSVSDASSISIGGSRRSRRLRGSGESAGRVRYRGHARRASGEVARRGSTKTMQLELATTQAQLQAVLEHQDKGFLEAAAAGNLDADTGASGSSGQARQVQFSNSSDREEVGSGPFAACTPSGQRPSDEVDSEELGKLREEMELMRRLRQEARSQSDFDGMAQDDAQELCRAGCAVS